MLRLLWTIPTLPALAFVALTLLNGRLSRRAVALMGAGGVGISAIVALAVSLSFMVSPPAGHAYRQVLWTWFDTGGLRPQIAFYLDAMTVIFVLVITVVGFLILLYSGEFMEADEGYTRFFMYMNLFVAAMLVLVLADNLLLLYVGWEGVGLCSYLLIAFWHKDVQNVYAGRKAFIVTRVGDTALIAGLFLLFTQFHTLEIQPLMAQAARSWAAGGGLAVAAAALLLGGAVGKSAQIPLQTWLPDAMAGPTPVSALIHAATMVTAGVYLIARTHVLFTLAPDVRLAVAVVGTVTLLYAGFCAIAQHDIKRVLAYSTISQIGYMFLALGVSGWAAAVFHFMTHAFFKALLFLAAGVVIQALGGEHDMLKMGGLRRLLPVAFWGTVVGAASLSALPLVTAGYYSKDLVIATSLGSVNGSLWLWLAAVAGAFLTAVYTFRLVFLVFFGAAQTPLTLAAAAGAWPRRCTRWARSPSWAGSCGCPRIWVGSTLCGVSCRPLCRRRPPPAAASPTASRRRSRPPSSCWPASPSLTCCGSGGGPPRRRLRRGPRPMPCSSTGTPGGASIGSTSASSCAL